MENFELFDYWTFDIEDKFLEFQYSRNALERIVNLKRKDVGNGEIMIVKRVSDSNSIVGIEKTARDSKKRVLEWKDRVLIKSIDVECVDLLEKLLHFIFQDFRIKRINQKTGNNEVEWFDFKNDNLFHSFISNTKMVQKIAKLLNEKSKIHVKNVQRLDINKANFEDLITLAGIGNVLAKRILDHQPYQNIEDLKKLKGVKDGVFGKIERFIYV